MNVSLVLTLAVAAALAGALSASLHRSEAPRSWPVGALLWIEAFVAIFVTVAMLLSALLQVIVRHQFSANFDFSWTEELSRLLLVWMTFWAGATVQRSNDHIHVSVIYDLLPTSVQTLLRRGVDSIVLLILLILAKEGFQSAWLQMGQTTITLDLPVSIFAVAVPVGCTLMLVYTALNGCRDLLGRSNATH